MTHRALLIIWIYLNSRSANLTFGKCRASCAYISNQPLGNQRNDVLWASQRHLSKLDQQMTVIWDKSIFAPDKSPLIFLKCEKWQEWRYSCFRGCQSNIVPSVRSNRLSHFGSSTFNSIKCVCLHIGWAFVVRHGIRVIEIVCKDYTDIFLIKI